jgi:hypothetical protein
MESNMKVFFEIIIGVIIGRFLVDVIIYPFFNYIRWRVVYFVLEHPEYNNSFMENVRNGIKMEMEKKYGR